MLGSLRVVHLSDCKLIELDQVIAVYGVAACKYVNTRGCYPSNNIILIIRFSKSSLITYIFSSLPRTYTLRNFAKWHHGSEKKILVQTRILTFFFARINNIREYVNFLISKIPPPLNRRLILIRVNCCACIVSFT